MSRPFEGRRNALESKRDDVRIVERGHGEHRAAECGLEALQGLVEPRVVVHEIDHHRAGLGKREERGGVELGARELRHVLLVVKRIDHQQVAAFGRQGLCAVANLDREARVIGRQPEMRAGGGHDARIELDYAHSGFSEMPEKKLRQRTAAETDHQRLARLGMEQQEGHHAARVLELERERVGEAHRALDRLAADVQRAHAARIVHCYRCFLLADGLLLIAMLPSR